MVYKNKKKKVPFSVTHPSLMQEWDFEKNGDFRPESVTYGSGMRAWWVCCTCGYSWEALIHNRTKKINPRGCPACNNQVVTEDNSLAALFPDLLSEWDEVKNEISFDEVISGSHKKVWWVCKKCNNSWESSVCSRTKKKNKSGCPYCSGNRPSEENNLLVKFPEIASEWDYSKNMFGPEEVLPGSNKKVWWVCKDCGHSWEASVFHRSRGGGCPVKAGKVVAKNNSLLTLHSGLSSEWDYEKNIIGPHQVLPQSNKKVWWRCEEGHSWKTSICNRTLLENGCPYCTGRLASKENNLVLFFPSLCKEWDDEKNKIGPHEVLPGSGKKVWWKCKKGHSWQAIIKNRAKKGYPCPYCSGRRASKENNLLVKYPDLCEEWDKEKNKKEPSQYTPGSNKKVWWRCGTCEHSWESSIDSRSLRGSGCPYCSGGSISPVSQEWLDSLNILKEYREYKLESLDGRLFKVDGYDPKTNTVYEFLGDFWHGNPGFNRCHDKINPVNKKPFKQLYKETMDRLYLLKEAGYKVVYVWESDYREALK